MEPNISQLTIVTAWYRTKNKYNSYDIYRKWMSDFFLIKKCPIVVFTNEESLSDLLIYQTLPNVTLIVKEMTKFLTFENFCLWQNNNLKSEMNHPYINLDLNMIWNEKVNFLLSAVQLEYVSTPTVMWLDIGYFRCDNNTHMAADQVVHFPNEMKMKTLNSEKIYIGCVADQKERTRVKSVVTQRNSHNVPSETDLVVNASVIAGGCILVPLSLLGTLHKMFYGQLQHYLESQTYVKDDQTILTDIIFNNPELFVLVMSELGLNDKKYDSYMIFQRFL
jgi:hypothetical protein